MKKKVISALLTGTLLLGLSVGASAATVTTGVSQSNGTITVSGAVSNAATGQQITVLVVKDGTDLDDLKTSDVVYIDQVSATGNYSVSFQMPTGMNYGAYDVYVGGTEVTTLATTDFVVEGTKTLSGSRITTSANGANLTKIWIRAYRPGTTTLVSETKLKADGTFSMYVPAGAYDIKVGRSGYLTKTYSNVAVNANNDSMANGLCLLAGDVEQNGLIDVTDWSTLMNVLGYSGDAFMPETDFNDDVVTDISDLSGVTANLGQNYQ